MTLEDNIARVRELLAQRDEIDREFELELGLGLRGDYGDAISNPRAVGLARLLGFETTQAAVSRQRPKYPEANSLFQKFC
jgi:hypothetical protein